MAKTLVTVSMAFDWPEEELHELAAQLDASVRQSFISSLAPVAMKHGLSGRDIDELLNEHFEFYGVSLMPQQEVTLDQLA